ncbi:sulfite exporter TauE/SafE family protein [Marinovum sp. 2_MG-2023]|uniref:sulfite exporter TauE/SafE family protein n=1 Tax=unclassified Marinovum TaxID=2647166 RepID=UPI0026E17B0E|nr:MULTISPECIES: sulfite exporter TauE/SafE family protein [unclassified Marinovum]MDO6731202.1 sulfite exporter TauE/SafE family protein [Marinovum sp. 2_MG-2023]MDO6780646.1 sulfite exporter TauE/SafE family protein [Marinovum sp. 1_MG-2023]
MEFWIVAGLAAFMLGLSKGGVPMLAMLSVPFMSIFMAPTMAAGLLLPLYILADTYAIYLFRKAFSVKNLKIMLPGAVVGVLAAFFSVSVVPGDAIKLLVAGIGFYYLINSVRNRMSGVERQPKQAGVRPGLFWGTLAGFTSYISHAGGPPFQAYVLPQKLDKMVYLGTTTIFFAVVNLMKLPPYIVAGQITWESLPDAMWLAPCTLLGAWSGARIARVLPQKVFFILVELALAAVSLKLVYEVIVG